MSSPRVSAIKVCVLLSVSVCVFLAQDVWHGRGFVHVPDAGGGDDLPAGPLGHAGHRPAAWEDDGGDREELPGTITFLVVYQTLPAALFALRTNSWQCVLTMCARVTTSGELFNSSLLYSCKNIVSHLMLQETLRNNEEALCISYGGRDACLPCSKPRTGQHVLFEVCAQNGPHKGKYKYTHANSHTFTHTQIVWTTNFIYQFKGFFSLFVLSGSNKHVIEAVHNV